MKAEKLEDLTPNPTISDIQSAPETPSFPPDTAHFMSWKAIKFINSPTSRMLDLTCMILIGTFIMCLILGKALQIDVSVRGPAEIAVDGGVREIVSPIDGLVTKVFKKNGDGVKEQELIARLQIDEETSGELESLSQTIQSLTNSVEGIESPETLIVVTPQLIRSSKIYDPAVLQAMANIEHAIHDFQLQRNQVLILTGKANKNGLKTEKTNSEIYYSLKRIDFLTKRLSQMRASRNRELLASYIDSTEEELGRLKNQVTSAQVRVRAALDQGYADLLRSLKIAIGVLNDFKQHHEIRSPIAGVIGKIIDGDNTHVIVNKSIATIIPINSQFMAHIKMKSKDIVHIKKGQAVYFKVEAYPFQRYGLFTGNVTEFDQIKETSSGTWSGTQSSTDDDFILSATINPPANLNENLKKQIKFIFGMKAEATVVMERKSIDNIIMDKFFNLKDL